MGPPHSCQRPCQRRSAPCHCPAPRCHGAPMVHRGHLRNWPPRPAPLCRHPWRPCLCPWAPCRGVPPVHCRQLRNRRLQPAVASPARPVDVDTPVAHPQAVPLRPQWTHWQNSLRAPPVYPGQRVLRRGQAPGSPHPAVVLVPVRLCCCPVARGVCPAVVLLLLLGCTPVLRLPCHLPVAVLLSFVALCHSLVALYWHPVAPSSFPVLRCILPIHQGSDCAKPLQSSPCWSSVQEWELETCPAFFASPLALEENLRVSERKLGQVLVVVVSSPPDWALPCLMRVSGPSLFLLQGAPLPRHHFHLLMPAPRALLSSAVAVAAETCLLVSALDCAEDSASPSAAEHGAR